MERICVFCGSSTGNSPSFRQAAVDLATALRQRGLGLVYGGAQVGLMGVLADTMIEYDGEVIGVIPQALVDLEVGHTGITRLEIVGSMHERKARMVELADGFIALPGGFGTLEEFCEIVTWAQLGLHGKPCGLLDVDRYFDPLLALFDQAVDLGFLNPEHRALVLHANTPDRLLELVADFNRSTVPQLLNRAEA